ncbi:MAG: hypothetical protein QM451_12295 [Bacillota bacterium]|jgi:hypothetical protein|nr:hypothetical protein [Bacillota bacterium]HHT90394.1 hypothetical protein [Bacillota bacterium]
MRNKVILLAVLFFSLGVRGTAWATDFDDLFGGDLFVELEEEQGTLPPEEALLVQDGWDYGGNYRFSANASRTLVEGADPLDNLGVSLGGQLYLDARPDPNFRVFGKLGLSSAVNKQRGGRANAQDPLEISLQELFSDFNYENKVFFRAGKQNVKWGVGYFFSPADVINIGRLDPLDPGAEREGPVALKVHYPRGSTNYYLYTLLDDVDVISKVALAPKMEFVVGGTEIGLGGFYQKDKAPRGMLTFSSSLGDFAIFGEAVLSKGSDKAFAGDLPFHYPVYKKDQLFFHTTVGARYSHDDPEGLFNLTAAAQYYFNGEGYRKQEEVQNLRKYYGLLLITNPAEAAKIRLTDLGSTGRHYLGAMVGWNKLLNTKLSVSIFLNSNLSDQSGTVSATLSLPPISKISPSIGVAFNYGGEATEFGGLAKSTTVFASVTLGSGSF